MKYLLVTILMSLSANAFANVYTCGGKDDNGQLFKIRFITWTDSQNVVRADVTVNAGVPEGRSYPALPVSSNGITAEDGSWMTDFTPGLYVYGKNGIPARFYYTKERSLDDSIDVFCYDSWL